MRTRGPIESDLDELWTQHERGWRRLLSRNAMREVRLRAQFDTDLLVPARIANKVSSGMIPDCERCTNICCAGYENVVSLRLRDVAMLIDIGRTDLISLDKPRFPPDVLADRPGLVDLASSMLWLTLPVLRQVGDLRTCAALTSDLRCSLHPNWPSSCERFPFALSAVRREVVWGSRCQSKTLRPEHRERTKEMFDAAVAAYNERIRDAVLLAHARDELDEIGIGEFLCDPEAPTFEPKPRLPVLP